MNTLEARGCLDRLRVFSLFARISNSWIPDFLQTRTRYTYRWRESSLSRLRHVSKLVEQPLLCPHVLIFFSRFDTSWFSSSPIDLILALVTMNVARMNNKICLSWTFLLSPWMLQLTLAPSLNVPSEIWSNYHSTRVPLSYLKKIIAWADGKTKLHLTFSPPWPVSFLMYDLGVTILILLSVSCQYPRWRIDRWNSLRGWRWLLTRMDVQVHWSMRPRIWRCCRCISLPIPYIFIRYWFGSVG